MKLTLAPIDDADVPLLTQLMAAAFDADAPKDAAFDQQLLACYHNSDFFQRWPPGCIDTFVYTLWLERTPVGAAVIWYYSPDDAVLGLFFIALPWQNQGLGLRCWQELEQLHADVRHWTVAAPLWSPATGRFYERQCGFQLAGMSGPYYVCYAKDRPTPNP